MSNRRSSLPPEALQAQSVLAMQLLLNVNTDQWKSYLEALDVDHASFWKAASKVKAIGGLVIP